MMASAAARHPPAAPESASWPRILVIFWYGKGSPITPVEAMNTSCARQPTTPAADSATSRTASWPALPVKALALPLLTTRTRAELVGELLAAPIDRRRRRLGLGEDAGHLGSRRHHHQQDIGAVAIFDAGLARRQPYARKRGQACGGPGGQGRLESWTRCALRQRVSPSAPGLPWSALRRGLARPVVSPCITMALLPPRRFNRCVPSSAARLGPNLRELTRGGAVLISPQALHRAIKGPEPAALGTVSAHALSPLFPGSYEDLMLALERSDRSAVRLCSPVFSAPSTTARSRPRPPMVARDQRARARVRAEIGRGACAR